MTSDRCYMSYIITWSCMFTACVRGSVLEYITMGINCEYLSFTVIVFMDETFSLDFCIFWHLVSSRYLDLDIHLIFPLHFINRYHETLLEWYAIFIISSFSYFPFSDYEMTHVTIGLRRTCSSPSPWPGHPPSVWRLSPCAIACVCMRRWRRI